MGPLREPCFVWDHERRHGTRFFYMGQRISAACAKTKPLGRVGTIDLAKDVITVSCIPVVPCFGVGQLTQVFENRGCIEWDRLTGGGKSNTNAVKVDFPLKSTTR